MAVKKETLLAGLAQLKKKYQGVEICLMLIKGVPAYIMQGATAAPSSMPKTFTLPDDAGRPVMLPILWHQTKKSLGVEPVAVPPNKDLDTYMWQGVPVPRKRLNGDAKNIPPPSERDLDASMWAGVPPASRRDVVTVYKPSMHNDVSTQMDVPSADVTPLQISADIALASEEGWWDKSFDMQGCICCAFYMRPVVIFRYVVPQDHSLTIDGWGFAVYGNFPVGWEFNVRFERDGENLLSYDEVVVDPLNPDPSKRCLFSSSVDMVMAAYLRLDRNQTFQVIITPKGLAPFLVSPFDTICGSICCLMHGHLTALLDNRDGFPRPKDVGRMRDDVWGDETLYDVTQEDLDQLMKWLSGATTDAFNQVGSNLSDAEAEAQAAADAAAAAAQAAADAAAAAEASKKPIWPWVAAAAGAAVALGEEIPGSSVSPNPLS